MAKLNSPFRYPGGKFYARKLIIDQIAKHDKYCEPFCGGASIFFAKELSNESVLNDKDAELTNCFVHIRDHVENLIDSLDGIKATKELHTYFKKYTPKTKLDEAMRWYYLNRTSYSGIMKMQNCFWGYGDKYSMRPENWPRHLRRTSEKLQGVKISNLDFEEVISNLDDGFFLFVDPPYFNADQDKFYTCSFIAEDHERLMTVMKKNAGRHEFIITYDNTPEICQMYNWCNIKDQSWNYTISRTDDQKTNKKLEDGFKGKRKQGKELFITNYEHTATEHTTNRPHNKVL